MRSKVAIQGILKGSTEMRQALDKALSSSLPGKPLTQPQKPQDRSKASVIKGIKERAEGISFPSKDEAQTRLKMMLARH